MIHQKMASIAGSFNTIYRQTKKKCDFFSAKSLDMIFFSYFARDFDRGIPLEKNDRRDARVVYEARLESVCTQNVPRVRIPLSPPNNTPTKSVSSCLSL